MMQILRLVPRIRS